MKINAAIVARNILRVSKKEGVLKTVAFMQLF